ncbi:restriction endonuclease subunit S [Streptobacillus felis]|uniref:restriction endonuclease subunit S n=1 Tax=Streptobacillus felis TaxID=1384509 RepID=UPI001E3570FE|nr:restriction endonuclease subunit S [Streptobacillus felis]
MNKSTSGTIPLVSHQHKNNGVSKYVGNYGDRKIFNFNDTISLADRGVFKASTQNENFYIGTRVKALQFKDGNKSLEQRLFIVSQINKLQVFFEDYSINATDSLPNLKIELPFNNKKLDFKFMEDFIRVIEKLVIKDVVLWAEKKIQATKKIINT